jgi:predicted Fe-Mo cluster-binding NifX family protein
MKTAFAYWENRIAPVFDIARQIHVVETESGRIIAEAREDISNDLPAGKVTCIVDLGINILVCGAISRQLQVMITASGIRIISFVTGDLRKIINAWLDGKLEGGGFAMPGCCRRYAAPPEKTKTNTEEHLMYGRRRMRIGQSGAVRQGRGRREQRFTGGTLAGGSTGNCLCPKCGNREPHERGVPCMQKQCPKCGSAMARE